jgi:hypothetical protein
LRQNPVLERRAVSKRARLAGEDRNIMPRVVDDLAASKEPAMLGDDGAVLPDREPVG